MWTNCVMPQVKYAALFVAIVLIPVRLSMLVVGVVVRIVSGALSRHASKQGLMSMKWLALMKRLSWLVTTIAEAYAVFRL